jgi:hypothetical protein
MLVAVRPAQPVRGALAATAFFFFQRRLDRAVQPLSDRSLPDRDPGRGGRLCHGHLANWPGGEPSSVPIAMERLGAARC